MNKESKLTVAKTKEAETALTAIPQVALHALQRIFLEGRRKYGSDNWKSGDKKFLLERFEHYKSHENILLTGYEDSIINEDHLAKMLWFLVILCWYRVFKPLVYQQFLEEITDFGWKANKE